MKVKGTVTRVVEGKTYFRPEDPTIFRSLATANLTASGEIVVDVNEEEPHEVGENGDFEVGGDGDDQEDADADDEAEEDAPAEEAATQKAAGKGSCPACGAELFAAKPKAKAAPKAAAAKPAAKPAPSPEGEATPPDGEARA